MFRMRGQQESLGSITRFLRRAYPLTPARHLPQALISDMPFYEGIKVAAVAAYLTELESNPDRVRGLAGWDWIEDAIQRLPERYAA